MAWYFFVTTCRSWAQFRIAQSEPCGKMLSGFFGLRRCQRQHGHRARNNDNSKKKLFLNYFIIEHQGRYILKAFSRKSDSLHVPKERKNKKIFDMFVTPHDFIHVSLFQHTAVASRQSPHPFLSELKAV